MRALALALALVPQMAPALSCLFPEIEDEFHRLQQADAVYSIVAGRLSFDDSVVQSLFDKDGTAIGGVFPARITGEGLGPDGFQLGVVLDLTVTVSCAGPWCGGVSARDEIYILRHESDGYHLNAGPCRAAFVPTAETRARFEACMAGGC